MLHNRNWGIRGYDADAHLSVSRTVGDITWTAYPIGTEQINSIMEFFNRTARARHNLSPKNSYELKGVARDLIYNRVWVETRESNPRKIDAGFILEDETYPVIAWNSYFAKTKYITGFSFDNSNGLSYSFTPPETLDPGELYTIYLTVDADGPAQQDTTLTITASKDDYVIEIVGTRVVDAPFEPDWAQRVELGFVFETVVYASERLKEQRRPLRDKFQRTTSFAISEKGWKAQRALNKLIFARDKFIAIPIYYEGFFVTNAAASDTTINAATSLQYLWNLQNQCDLVLFYDFETGFTEMKKLSSASNTQIILSDELLNTFDTASTVVYPAFISYVDSINVNGPVEDFNSIKIKFTEK